MNNNGQGQEAVAMRNQTYRLVDNGKAIRCLQCGTTSENASDVMNKYCSMCKKFHKEYQEERMRENREEVAEAVTSAQPIIRSILAFILHVKDPQLGVPKCYADADKFLVQLKKDLTE